MPTASTMKIIRYLALCLSAAIALGAVTATSAAAATATKHATKKPTLSSTHYSLIRSHTAVLHGHAATRTALYAHTYKMHWHKVRTVHGSYRVTVRPSHTTWYRVGTSRHVEIKVAPKPVTTCGTWNQRMTGTWAVNNSGQYLKSSLFLATERLVCSAAYGATINIRMYYVQMGGAEGTISGIVRDDLLIMHKYHAVRVNVLVQSNGFGWWRDSQKAMPWAHFYTCNHGCQSGTDTSKAHSKWITVSRMKYGSGSGVLTTSANLSNQQYTNWEDGVLSIGNYKLYEAVNAHWNSDVTCSLQSGDHCTKISVPGTWMDTSDPDTQVYFAPLANDLIQAQLAAVDCSQGGDIYYASLGMARYHIRQQFLRMQDQGCKLHIVIEHPSVAYAGLSPLTHTEHDKLLVVRTPTANMVLAGSECFTPGGLTVSDNIMLRLTQPWIVNGYTDYAKKLWSASYYVPPVSPAVAAAFTAIADATD